MSNKSDFALYPSKKSRSSSSSQPAPQRKTVFGCGYAASFIVLVLVIISVLAVMGFVVLQARNSDLSKRLDKLEKIHAQDALRPATRAAEKEPEPSIASTKLPAPEGNEFDMLLTAGREKAATDNNVSPFKFSDTAATNSAASHGHWHADEDLESYHFQFSIQNNGAEAASGTGIRVPESGSIENLSIDRLITFNVCCSVDEKTKTCPPPDQISVLVRNAPEDGEKYLRVLVRNSVYFNKQCIFYWLLKPQEK